MASVDSGEEGIARRLFGASKVEDVFFFSKKLSRSARSIQISEVEYA